MLKGIHLFTNYANMHINNRDSLTGTHGILMAGDLTAKKFIHFCFFSFPTKEARDYVHGSCEKSSGFQT